MREYIHTELFQRGIIVSLKTPEMHDENINPCPHDHPFRNTPEKKAPENRLFPRAPITIRDTFSVFAVLMMVTGNICPRSIQ